MKDKNLRKALGIHGNEENLCGCSFGATIIAAPEWRGELPMLWERIEELEAKIEAIEVNKAKEKSNKPRGKVK